ncbi:hypothetical protein QOZ80_8BG0660770 [Eleusine coracana subsp. coracana]|nr:hypothetical protein QOZ80_8BG0660770 [Eleusine coracana subsp. coracana]
MIKCAPNLPQEIIDEILLLLPARSILRSRAVCRSWAAQLCSPGFTEAYAASAVARRNRKFVVFAPSASSPRRSTAVYSCGSIQSGGAAADPLFTVDGLRTDFLSMSSSRPSRGLVLFSDTRTLGRYWDSAGVMCEVCTLGGPSCQWRPAPTCQQESERSILISLQTEEAVTKVPPVWADGCLHWLRYPPRRPAAAVQGRGAILRFSAADETFGFVGAPESVPLDVYSRLEEEHFPMVPVHLAELKGLLCMVHDLRRRGASSSSLDVWVLSRDREWSLDYRIPVITPSLMARGLHDPRFITVLGCCNNYSGQQDEDEEKLLVATSEHKVFSLAMKTGRVETVFSIGDTSIGLQRDAPAALWIGLYEDSLVRIIGDEESHGEKEALLSAAREVLLRLPLKSILRCKLVCRKWRALIESESFVAAHLSFMKKRPKRIVIATNGRARRVFFRFAPLKSWLRASSDALATSLVDGKIICSKPCHGLNLISTRTDDYLCNPCTGAIQCLGIRGRSRFFAPCRRDDVVLPISCHAFTVGRNIGFGFDQSTGEHVAVEIGHIGGALACMLKTTESDAWTCAGTPPMAVTEMPPAHVDGTLYWMGEQIQVIVAFDISARAFHIIQCEQPCRTWNKDDHGGAFLVELNNTLSLVLTNREAKEMEIWMMNIELRTWAKVHRHPPYKLAFPMLCEESLVPVHDEDELPVHHVAPPLVNGPRRCDHPEHAIIAGDDYKPRPVLPMCQNDGCQGIEHIFYSRCCKRLVCIECLPRCAGHYRGRHLTLDNRFDEVIEGIILRNGVPVEHPFVPDPDYYGHHYSAIDGDVVRHVFISLKDFVRFKKPCHLTECAYRMDGHGNVRQAWVRRYLDFFD